LVDVVGPVCESSDFFAKDRKVLKVEQGDYLSIFTAGAYGFAMASNYNSRPRATEVLVKNDQYFIVRERETYEDLIKGESIPKFLF
jgi:diaminopimelate decarboxylase